MSSLKYRNENLTALFNDGQRVTKLYSKNQLLYDISDSGFYTLETPLNTIPDSNIGGYEWTIYVKFTLNTLPATPSVLVETTLNSTDKTVLLLNPDGTLSLYKTSDHTTTPVPLSPLVPGDTYDLGFCDAYGAVIYDLSTPHSRVRSYHVLLNDTTAEYITTGVSAIPGEDMGNAQGNFKVGGDFFTRSDIEVQKIEVFNLYPNTSDWVDIRAGNSVSTYFEVDLLTDKINLIQNGSFTDGLTHWLDLAYGMYSTDTSTVNQLTINGQQMGPYLVSSGGDVESEGLALANNKRYLWGGAVRGAATFYFNSVSAPSHTVKLDQGDAGGPTGFTHYMDWCIFRRSYLFDFEMFGGANEPWVHCYAHEDTTQGMFDELSAIKVGKVLSFTSAGFSDVGTTSAKLILKP